MKYHRITFTILLAVFTLSSITAAQDNPAPKKEFRAVWIATVINLDWPTNVGVNAARFQKENLREHFDDLKEAGINAILFQVRTEADALYDSNYEPWSKYLTGEEGVAPDPYWDPLAFAVEEAHKRGMELHAWLNPYRADRNVTSGNKVSYIEGLSSIENHLRQQSAKPPFNYVQDRASSHITNTHPEWILTIGNIAIMNPGIPDVMDYITDVTMDIVNRYDVDGIHFDDYFYPYSPNTISDEDESTYNQYGGDFNNIGDWRRHNVNTMVEMVHDSIKSVKQHVKFGISPFGRHSEGYNSLYADAYTWLDGKYLDYINPQLYWEMTRFYSGTDFDYLYDTWEQNRNGRHIYAGHAIYRASTSTGTGEFGPDEVPNQIEYVRSAQDSTGSVFFRMENITKYSSGNFKEKLMTNYYRYPALPSPMHWLNQQTPPAPQNFTLENDTDQDHLVHLSWERPAYDNGNDSLLKYVVYRVRSSNGVPSADTVMTKSNYMAYITGQTSYTDAAPGGEGETYYFVTAANRNSVESETTEINSAGVITSAEQAESIHPDEISLSQNYPNPFNPSTTILYTLKQAGEVSLTVYNSLGQTVQELVDDKMQSAGEHTITFSGDNLPSGLYFYRLKAGETVLIRKMTLIK